MKGQADGQTDKFIHHTPSYVWSCFIGDSVIPSPNVEERYIFSGYRKHNHWTGFLSNMYNSHVPETVKH